jgi:hypothetical protein
MWAAGFVGGLVRDSSFYNYLTLVVGCGLVGRSQIVRQRHNFSSDVVLLQSNVGYWACGWIGKGQLIFILISLWLWAVDLWVDLQ